MRERNLSRIYVHKDFKKKLKIEATRKGMTTTDYSYILSRDDNDIEQNESFKINGKKKKFKFKI